MKIYELIKTRRTIRKFKNTKIGFEQIERYIDAARLAPSAMNLQPLKYVAVTSEEVVNSLFELVKWAGYLKGSYTPKETEKPTAFIAVCVDKNLTAAPSEFDLGAAIQNLCLSAFADGVGSCIMGAIDREKIIEVLELSENLSLAYVVALGYCGETPSEAQVKNGDIKYYLEGNTLNVPKRSLEDVLIKNV